jgi:hypothetical protein
MTPIKTVADALRKSHPKAIAWIERQARTEQHRQPEFTDYGQHTAVEEERPGEWIEVADLKAGDEVDINCGWVSVLNVFQHAGQFMVVMDGQAEGTLGGFKCWPGEMWYRRKQTNE